MTTLAYAALTNNLKVLERKRMFI